MQITKNNGILEAYIEKYRFIITLLPQTRYSRGLSEYFNYKKRLMMSEIIKVLEDVKPTSIINVDGLHCPLPFFRTKKNVDKISVGEIIQVDGMPKFLCSDIQKWCERNGHFFFGEKESFGCVSFFVKKG